METNEDGKSGFKSQFDELMLSVNKKIGSLQRLTDDTKELLDEILYRLGVQISAYAESKTNMHCGTCSLAAQLRYSKNYVNEIVYMKFMPKRKFMNELNHPPLDLIFSKANANKIYKLKDVDKFYFTWAMQKIASEILMNANNKYLTELNDKILRYSVSHSIFKSVLSPSKEKSIARSKSTSRDVGSPKKSSSKTKKKEYERMTVKELKENAKGKVPGYYKLNKAGLVDALNKLDNGSGSSGGARSKSPPRKKPSSPKSPKTSKKLTKDEIKQIKNHELKVVDLKDLLRDLGLPHSGKKADLEARLLSLKV